MFVGIFCFKNTQVLLEVADIWEVQVTISNYLLGSWET